MLEKSASKKSLKKLKKGVDFLQIITYNTTCLEERTKQKTKNEFTYDRKEI